MKQLIEILKLNQLELKFELYEYLINQKYDPIFEDGFLYAKGDIPVLLVAHMDTVLVRPPKHIFYNEKKDMLYGFNTIGGDDRCGIYAIMKILEEYKPHVIFTEDEEIGGIGAEKATYALDKPNVKFMIELDRKGNNDCVFYDCGNNEFQKFIESFDFVTELGTFSDISILASKWDIAAVNLSSAFYKEHTKEEYVKFKELLEIINRVKGILSLDYNNIPDFDYQKVKYAGHDNIWSDFYDLPLIKKWLEEYNDKFGSTSKKADKENVKTKKIFE